MKLIKSPWVASIIGMILYMLITAVSMKAAVKKNAAANTASQEAPHEEESEPGSGVMPSWTANSSDVDEMIKELRLEKETLKIRTKQLGESEARLVLDRQEMNQMTQVVGRMQKEFEAAITRVAEEETANLKRLAKTYSLMTPESAAQVFKQLEETSLVKVLMYMKDAQVSAILDRLAKEGETEAKRVAAISERLRLSINPNNTNSPAK